MLFFFLLIYRSKNANHFSPQLSGLQQPAVCPTISSTGLEQCEITAARPASPASPALILRTVCFSCCFQCPSGET